MKRTVPFLWPATMTLSLTSMSPESDRDDALDLLRPATQITLHLSLTSIEVTSQTETLLLTCSDLPHKSLYTCLWPLCHLTDRDAALDLLRPATQITLHLSLTSMSPDRQRRCSWLAQTCHTNHSTLVSDLYVTWQTETLLLTCSDLPHKSLYTCLWPLCHLTDRDAALDLLRPATQITLHLSLTSMSPDRLRRCSWLAQTCHTNHPTFVSDLYVTRVRQRRWSWLAQTCHTNHSTLVSALLEVCRKCTSSRAVSQHVHLFCGYYTGEETTEKNGTKFRSCVQWAHTFVHLCNSFGNTNIHAHKCQTTHAWTYHMIHTHTYAHTDTDTHMIHTLTYTHQTHTHSQTPNDTHFTQT